MKDRIVVTGLLALAAIAVAGSAMAQELQAKPGEEGIQELAALGIRPTPAAPPRSEGEGPFSRMVIRGATLIDGTGAPPIGPVDIVIEGDRITTVRSIGNPGVDVPPERRPESGDFEIDASGMYVLPGFIDAHAHIATPMHQITGPAPPAEYVYKLWLAHGITTIRENSAGNGLGWTLSEKRRSDKNEITAPRMVVYTAFPAGKFSDPGDARKWVASVARSGADGIKFFGAPPQIMQAALDEASKRDLRTSMHHAQMAVARTNVLDTSGWGLNSMEHWYGLPEALFTDRVVQDYPLDYNYNNEQDRFGQAGRLWKQAALPGSDHWNQVMNTLLERDFTLVPTMTIYEASRDLSRAMNAPWHDEYTLPTLWRWYQPSREAHGSYWFYWTTKDEIEWKHNFQIWMQFLNEYKNRGGRIAIGSDAGYIFKLFGFAYIRELELLQEAGFHPLEVIRSATLQGAQLIGRDDSLGTVEIGKLADLVLIEHNPLENLKVLYGTGAFKLDDETNTPGWVGGVRYTIKDGIVYDAPTLLEDVKAMVSAAKQAEAQ